METFSEFCDKHQVTKLERKALIRHLALHRSTKTLELEAGQTPQADVALNDLLCVEKNKAKLLYNNYSPVDTYECQHCAKEFTTLEVPLYCLLCGVKVDVVD